MEGNKQISYIKYKIIQIMSSLLKIINLSCTLYILSQVCKQAIKYYFVSELEINNLKNMYDKKNYYLISLSVIYD